MTSNRNLPLGVQDFEELRKGNYLYVDKTDMVWAIANQRKYNYLSRPRRFGKSLLASTLKCYFEGKTELFEGLKIMSLEKDWIKRPVIYLSMSLGGSDAQSLKEYLNERLSYYEKIYGKNPAEQSLGNRFNGIIERAYQQAGTQIAVIVDEYDVPLQHTYETEHHDECRTIYRDFFTGLKDYGYCIKCVFITGITKFTQISLFSTLNTLVNISFEESLAAVCGITNQELLFYFQKEIAMLSEKCNLSETDTINEMKSLYDGYHFAPNMLNVYNPYSVLSAFSRGKLNSYWIASGSNEMLFKILNKFAKDIPKLDNCLIDADYLEESDVNMIDPKLFLYQAGYLTIKAVDGDTYILGYPNREAKKSIYELVLPLLLSKNIPEVNNELLQMRIALKQTNVDQAMLSLKQLIANTPYSTQRRESFVLEEHFRFILKNIFYLCGYTIHEEKQVAAGRIDLVAISETHIYIMELKMEDNGGLKAASEQMQTRHYKDAFAASKKQVTCIVLSFSRESRGLEAWDIVE